MGLQHAHKEIQSKRIFSSFKYFYFLSFGKLLKMMQFFALKQLTYRRLPIIVLEAENLKFNLQKQKASLKRAKT